MQLGDFHYKSKEACNFSEYKAKWFIRSTGCQHILIWYISGICHTHKTYTRSEKNNIISILGDTCRRLVYVDEEGGRELKHQYLPYRNHYFWSRWLLRPAGRQARHWGWGWGCKIIVWGFALQGSFYSLGPWINRQGLD